MQSLFPPLVFLCSALVWGECEMLDDSASQCLAELSSQRGSKCCSSASESSRLSTQHRVCLPTGLIFVINTTWG